LTSAGRVPNEQQCARKRQQRTGRVHRLHPLCPLEDDERPDLDWSSASHSTVLQASWLAPSPRTRSANTWPWRHFDGIIDLSSRGQDRPSCGPASRTAGMGWVLHTVNFVGGGFGGGGATATACLWIELAARRLVRTRPRTHASSPVTFGSEEATAMQYRSQLGTSLDRPARGLASVFFIFGVHERATHSRTRVAETVG
jgi:hypothetical protein